MELSAADKLLLNVGTLVPKSFYLMVECAAIIGINFIFIHVDIYLYDKDQPVVGGWLAIAPGSGVDPLEPAEFDKNCLRSISLCILITCRSCCDTLHRHS